MIDRKIFFDQIRESLFGGALTQAQVDGMSDMLDAWERSGFADLRWLAYIFGGVFWETGQKMIPVREGFADTDAAARAAVAKLLRQGRIKRNYALPNKAGVSFYGRGRIQNTHEDNYRKLQARFGRPFLTQPDLLLDSKLDAEVTVYGHAEGIWTGKSLADYFGLSRTNWFSARQIVNGLDEAEQIAGYARKFFAALVAAQKDAQPRPAAPPESKPAPELSRSAEAPPSLQEAPKGLWSRWFGGAS